MSVYRILLYAITVTFFRDVNSARILGLFPHSGRSHQMVFEPLLQSLAERGHHVSVVSFFPLKNPPNNYTDVSLEGISPIGLETLNMALFESDSDIIQIPRLKKNIQIAMEFQFLADKALEICRKLVTLPTVAEVMKKEYDLVLMENFNSDCMTGLIHVYEIKAPVVALLSTAVMPWSSIKIGVTENPSYVPTMGTDLTDQMTFYERLENTIWNIYFKIWYRYAIQVKEQRIIEKHFGRKIPDLDDLGKNVSLMIVNTFHSFHGNRPSVPALVEAGGMHINFKNKKTIPPFMEKFLNESEHGVILFSLGSLIKTSTIPKYKEDIFVNVLSKLKQRVIWKYESSSEEGTLTGNILRVKWIPQFELLHHEKVVAFIAHGGLLGLTESISAGKPMVVIPFYGDQPYNAAAAVKKGFGRVLSYADLTEQSLTEALQSVLSLEMRMNARRVSAIWRDRPNKPLETAIYWVERVLRWGHEDPLHSVSRDLPLYQYLLLDVAAVILVVLLVLSLALGSILYLLLQYVRRIVIKEKKD